MIIQEHKQ